MSDMPERIWAWDYGEPRRSFEGSGEWYSSDVGLYGNEVEYIRADLAKPRVKPLVWEEITGTFYAVEDDVELSQFKGKWGVSPAGFPPYNYPYDTLEEAKAAAQEDYERRILDALEDHR